MTISEFHNQRINKIKYTRSDSVMVTTEDFYNEFLIKGKRPQKCGYAVVVYILRCISNCQAEMRFYCHFFLL